LEKRLKAYAKGGGGSLTVISQNLINALKPDYHGLILKP
jgi:hypothetical protein